MTEKDKRIEFIQQYTLKSMRLKEDKWNKIVIFDEQRQYLQVAGQLTRLFYNVPCARRSLIRTCHSPWSSHRTLPVTFTSTQIGQVGSVTRESTLSNEKRLRYQRMRLHGSSSVEFPHQDFNLCEFLAFGDIYPNALDHFCARVEEVNPKYINTNLSSDHTVSPKY